MLFEDINSLPFDEVKKLAEMGRAVAQNNLGAMYYVKQDYAEALKWYRKAAEQGNASAQYYLGYMYENGNGVPKNLHEARKWYQKAAEQENEYIANSAKEALKRIK